MTMEAQWIPAFAGKTLFAPLKSVRGEPVESPAKDKPSVAESSFDKSPVVPAKAGTH